MPPTTEGAVGAREAGSTAARPLGRELGLAAGAFAVYLLLAVLAFWDVWSTHPTTYMQLGGDQWRNVWFLGWFPFAIAHGHLPLYSGYANVPVGVNLLSAAGIPALGALFSPVTVIWGAIAAYNVAGTLALALSALAAYVLVRRLTSWWPAAFAGGLLYGFGPDIITQSLGHLNLAFAPVPPLIFLLLHELLVRRRWRPLLAGVLLGLLIVVQFFISSEILFDTAVVAAIVVVAIVVAGRGELAARWRHAAKGLVAALVTAVVLLAFPLWVMLAGPAHVSGKLDLVPQAYRADLLGPLIPDSNQLITFGANLTAHADHFASSAAENGSYLGIPLLLVLLAVIVFMRRNRTVVVVAFSGICAFILSLGGRLAIDRTPRLAAGGAAGGGIPLPELVFWHLPVLSNVEPVRFSLLVDLGAAVVLGCGLSALHARWARGRRHAPRSRWLGVAAPVALAAAALVLVIPSVPFQGIGFNGTPAAFTSGDPAIPSGGKVTVFFPFPSGAFPPPMLWQEQAGFRFKMAGGDFLVPQGPQHHVAFSPLLAYAPNSFTATTLTEVAQGTYPAETPALRKALLADMGSFRAAAVVAVPAYASDPARATAFLSWLLGPPSSTSGGVLIWSHIRS